MFGPILSKVGGEACTALTAAVRVANLARVAYRSVEKKWFGVTANETYRSNPTPESKPIRLARSTMVSVSPFVLYTDCSSVCQIVVSSGELGLASTKWLMAPHARTACYIIPRNFPEISQAVVVRVVRL